MTPSSATVLPGRGGARRAACSKLKPPSAAAEAEAALRDAGHRAGTGTIAEEQPRCWPDGLGRRGAQAAVVRGLHARTKLAGAAPDHGQDPADPAAAGVPGGPGPARRPGAGPAQDDPRVDAHARRAGQLFWRQRRSKLRADPDPRHLRLDGRLLPAPAPVRSPAKHAAARVEVFCFGTRLTRITRALEHRRPDAALELAAQAVVDWDGGTRIGASLDTFVRRWGRGGMCRGGVVVICSDGSTAATRSVLATAMERGRPCEHTGSCGSIRTRGDNRLPAQHAGHDGGSAAHRPAAVRARPGQPGGTRRRLPTWPQLTMRSCL